MFILIHYWSDIVSLDESLYLRSLKCIGYLPDRDLLYQLSWWNQMTLCGILSYAIYVYLCVSAWLQMYSKDNVLWVVFRGNIAQ